MKPPRSKYGNRKTVVDGITFASAKEAKRWCDLKNLERAGEIDKLQRQNRFVLFGLHGPILTPTGKQAAYIADFTYIDNKTNGLVIEDAKGYRTKEYLLKRAILAAMGLTIREV